MTHIIGVYDHATGEQTTREMTNEELATYEAEASQRVAEKEAAKAEKEAAKAALLQSLGITEEQAIILGLIQAEQSTPNLTDEPAAKS